MTHSHHYHYIIHPITQQHISIFSKKGDTLLNNYLKTGGYDLPIIHQGRSFHGWSQSQPHTTSDRRRLLEKCGEECFLLPHKHPPKFPICPKDKCLIDCQGVNSAYIRAKQWGYQEVAKKAKKLQTQHCHKKKLS